MRVAHVFVSFCCILWCLGSNEYFSPIATIHSNSVVSLAGEIASVFEESVISTAGRICDRNLEETDRQICSFLAANDIRLSKIHDLQHLLGYSYLRVHPELREVLLKNNFLPLRRRDHEMLAIMRHFDYLNIVPEPNLSIEKLHSVCFLGNQIRLHLLLTFLSFRNIFEVHYFTIRQQESERTNYYSEDDWGTVDELLSSVLLTNLLKNFPNKIVRHSTLHLFDIKSAEETWLQHGQNCSVILLPSDYDILYFGNVNMRVLFSITNSLSSSESIPVVWISDLFHENVVGNEIYNSDVGLFCPMQAQFQWYLQDTWPRHSILDRSERDSEGYPTFFHYLAALKQFDSFLTSSVYVGHSQSLNSQLFLQKSTVSHSSSLQVSKENVIVVITYQGRIYAETAKGLQQQLQEELDYPYVLIIPLLTLEILDILNEYLIDITTDQMLRGDTLLASRTLHFVQIVLTPHYPSSRLVSSWRYPLMKDHVTLREVVFSYVVVLLEQEWFFRLFAQSFVTSVSLVNDARSVWTFSTLQRQAVHKMYHDQIRVQNLHFTEKYFSANGSKEIPPIFASVIIDFLYL